MIRYSQLTLLTFVALFGAGACGRAPHQPSAVSLPAAVSSATAASSDLSARASGGQFTSFFSATALCGSEIGRIQFSGTIEGVDHTTVDANGEVHRTRQFRVKDMQAVNLDNGTTYVVIGGAEMLSWNTRIGQVPGVPARSQHAGTLVFEPTDGGPRVVAHHRINYVERPDGDVVLEFSGWKCVTS